MVEFIQVSTTVKTKEKAEKLAETLLVKRIASCVQVLGPIKSSYWWKGRIEHAKEWICLIKAMASDYGRIESSIKRMHDYDTPEVIALPILRGNLDYLDWIRRETRRRSRSAQKS
jgi:periplasmic divalent cation tolerance protein